MAKKSAPEFSREALSREFHEPARLALLCALASSESGLTFSQIKVACDLTDGNLLSHLKQLEASKIVLRKGVVIGHQRPATQYRLSAPGRRKFAKYLEALEDALQHAKQAIKK